MLKDVADAVELCKANQADEPEQILRLLQGHPVLDIKVRELTNLSVGELLQLASMLAQADESQGG